MNRVYTAVVALGLTVAMGVGPSFGQSLQGEPTKQEIAGAYRSKSESGGGGMFIPGWRWERWRVKKIRGWSLRFKRVLEKRNLGLLTYQYQVVARSGGSCARYLVTDTIPMGPGNAQMQRIVVVEPGDVTACR